MDDEVTAMLGSRMISHNLNLISHLGNGSLAPPQILMLLTGIQPRSYVAIVPIIEYTISLNSSDA